MSTLLRSPDASPSSFHYATTSSPTSHAHRPSSRSSHQFYGSSPRRPFNVPVEPDSIPTKSSANNSITAPVAGTAGYVDAGTQYSPDGYPPTAGSSHRFKHNKLAAGAGKPPGSEGRSAQVTRKRKGSGESQSSVSPTPEISPRASAGQMSGSSVTASDGAAVKVDMDNAAHAAPVHSVLQEARSTHGHSAAPKRAKPEPGSLKVMPLKYETCNPKDLGVLIANMLMELIRINDQIPLRDGRLTRFHSRAPPGISVSDYLQRLIQHATLSPPIMLSMVFYIDKLCTDYPAFTVNSLTVHRFLIAAATVAAKGLSDSFWTNPTYARIGGIPVSELATLELELLQRVDYRIVPKPETLEDYYASLVERADGYTLEEPISSDSESSTPSEEDHRLERGDGKDGKGKDEDEVMVDHPT